ncbi:MAG TPA: protein translocase subunit SecD [Candidatus Limnocylindrales bacterium]|nr:protein translocase subunit SecD [Candidatus Limnocylindrales bacterium]
MRRTGPILIVVIGLLALIVDFWPNLTLPALSSTEAPRKIETKLGLDLQGGLKVEYRVKPNGDRIPDAGEVEVVKQIIERRVNATGVSEPVVVTSGTDRIVVEVPGISDTAAIRKLVGQTGQLQFVPIPTAMTPPAQGQELDVDASTACPTTGSPTVPCVLFGGEELSSASVGSNQQGQRTVNFVLKSKGKDLFAAWTTAHSQEYFAIVLDHSVISAPIIKEPIPGGNVQIEAGGLGGFTRQEADEMVNVLRFGSLPFPVEELASDTIAPTLGQEFLHSSLLAGGIAILLVILFMLLHYRLPGAVASFALLYYSVLVLALFRLIPVTLTLAGIAGFVLSVGMAVDANILIFERTKEELRAGKSLAQAIEAGFARAWNSILDSNVSSLITAMILYLFGSSVIQGFALVLILGVLASMFTAITVTRSILRLVVGREWARKAWMYGVSESEFTARPSTRSGLRREPRSV